MAAKIRDNGRIDYECAVEGEVTERLTAVLPGADAVDLKRCRFLQVRWGGRLYARTATSPASNWNAPAPAQCLSRGCWLTDRPDRPHSKPVRQARLCSHRRCANQLPVPWNRSFPPQGDACNLPESLGTFDAVLAANLLCRVPEPAACIAQIKRALRPGGVALLTSPFSWLEQYTDRSNWIGGGYKDGLPNRWVMRLASGLPECCAWLNGPPSRRWVADGVMGDVA